MEFGILNKIYDAIKNVADKSTDKQEEYIHFSGSFSASVYEYRNVLNVSGKGKLYLALANCNINSVDTGVKITINPNSETEEVVFMRKIGGSVGSTSYSSVGFLSKEFYSEKTYMSSDGYYIAPCSHVLGKSVKLLTTEDAVSDTQTKDISTMLVLLSKKPIEFSEGVKIDIYANGMYDVIYSLDDNN